MNIAIGCDPAGLRLKRRIIDHLKAAHEVKDVGCYDEQPADYPDFADLVAAEIKGGAAERGILVCGTGVGVSIAANRHKGIRAVVGNTALGAVMSREHNDSNVLCFGQWTPPNEDHFEIIDAWLFGRFSKGAPHVRRIKKMDGEL